MILIALAAAYMPTVPGAVNPDVTQANIASTVCVAGYTGTIRPPVGYTNALKRKQMTALHLPGKPSDYEEDHLVSLVIGGSPSSRDNLWPEPWAGAHGARVKDRLEVALAKQVCSGKVPLAQAQHEIASDWVAAFRKYVGPLK